MFSKIKEKSKIISAIVKFQKSWFYPIIFALLSAVSSMFGYQVYVPIIWLLTLMVVFSALFCDDIKVLLVPIIFVYYAIGRDTSILDDSATRGDVFTSFNTIGLVNLFICGSLMVISMLVRLFESGAIKTAFTKRGLLTISLLILCGVFTFNGLFSDKWVSTDLFIGLMEGIVIFVFYTLILAICDGSKDIVSYICKLMTILGFMIILQVIVLSVRLFLVDKLFERNEAGEIIGFFRKYTLFSWGEFNIVGALLSICAIATLYLSYISKKGWIYMMLSSILYLGVTYSNARCSMLVGGVILIVGVILCLVKGKNRKACGIYFACFMLGIFSALALWASTFDSLKDFFRFLGEFFRVDDGDNGRFALWKRGMEHFLSHPIFGVGFLEGGYDVGANGNFYSNMYHNLLIEILGATGIVGALAFLLHLRGFGELIFRRFTVERFMLSLVCFFVLGASLLDNFFWYANFQIFYGIFLALLEISLEKSIETETETVKPVTRDKPRVVFTYVEAGKGHITPIEAISFAFRRKYGDKVEVVDSYFYKETGDNRLIAFEKGFSTTVKLQNKNAITGVLCHTGNYIAGNCLAQQFLMAMTPGGVSSCGVATKHLNDLDADLLFTAHWATCYYSKRLKNHPYTMMLCPDAYSNGMFDMDCNELLMSTDSGKNAVERRRFYAGGKITRVPFPIRQTAFDVEANKESLKEKYDVKDSFVITLCDGGYGMANLEKTAKELAKSNKNLLIFALCGTNTKLYERLKGLKTSPTVRLVPVDFTDNVFEYVAISHLFMGKSGANSMAEPAFFAVPIIVTKCITYIERDIKNYYVKEVGGALYIPNVKKAVKKVEEFIENESLRQTYADNMKKIKNNFGAEAVADLIYERLCKLKHNA